MAGYFIFFKKHLLRLSKIKNTAGAAGNPLAALTNSALLCIPQADNKKHLFEDTVHPTAETHQVIAAKIAKAMEAFN